MVKTPHFHWGTKIPHAVRCGKKKKRKNQRSEVEHHRRGRERGESRERKSKGGNDALKNKNRKGENFPKSTQEWLHEHNFLVCI